MKKFSILFEEILTESVEVNKIIAAINNKKAVEIYYNGDNITAKGRRKIYPHLLGRTIAGNLAIRAYQPEGSTATYVPEWKIFIIDKIANWTELEEIFEIAPKYNQYGDQMFNRIDAKI